MKRTTRTIVLAFFIAFLLPTAGVAAAADERMHGAWYFLRESVDPQVMENDIRAIADMGFSHILFPALVTQEKAESSEVRPPEKGYLETLSRGIDSAKKHGLKVGLTGFLLVEDGAWRGMILPASRKAWAKSYFEAIRPHAELAEEKGVELFCFATEMESLKSESRIWKNIARKTAEVYGGRIGYNANWWPGEPELNFILNLMPWLAELDFIGTSGYFELTDKSDPTVEELAAAWKKDRRGRDILSQFEAIKEKFPAQKLYLWELGYRSADGANTEPWNWGRKADADPGEQADCFDAFLKIFPGSALDGFAVWDQSAGFSARGPGDKGYDFIGKPAGDVIGEFLKSAAAPKAQSPKAAIEYQFGLLLEGDVERLRENFTERLRDRITPEMVEEGREEAKLYTLDDLVASVNLYEESGVEKAKIKMKNGRTLTVLVRAGDRWLADTIWFR